MAKILAPNAEYNGESASVTFKNGVAETEDNNLIGWFREHGYKIESNSQSKVTTVPNFGDTTKTSSETESNGFPKNFPAKAKKVFEKLGKTFAEVSAMTREQLIDVNGIAGKTADEIIALRA